MPPPVSRSFAEGTFAVHLGAAGGDEDLNSEALTEEGEKDDLALPLSLVSC